MTSAIAPVAAEIIARRPPTIEIVTAIVNEANSPTCGSTPARIENEIASGINANATARPARISMRSRFGERSALFTDESSKASGSSSASSGESRDMGLQFLGRGDVGWGRPCGGTGTQQHVTGRISDGATLPSRNGRDGASRGETSVTDAPGAAVPLVDSPGCDE